MRPPSRAATFSALLGGLAIASAAHATTIPGGNIINQIWTTAGSPYIVQGDVTIPAGAFLNIQAGVDVQFASFDGQGAGLDALRVEMTVHGTLTASGTAVAPITFHAQSGSGTGVWYGIVVGNGATSASLTHVILNHSSNGVRSSAPSGITSLNDVTLDVNDYDMVPIGAGLPAMSGRIAAGRFLGSVTIPSGATLANNRSLGLLQGGTLTLASGSTYEATLSSMASYEQFEVLGGVSLAGALALDVGGLTATPGDGFTLLDNDLIDPVAGEFDGLPGGSEFDAGAYRFQIFYNGGTSNDVVLVVVPSTTAIGEPGLVAAGGGRPVWTSPNPAARSTRVFFRAEAGGPAEVRIFDTAGRLVRTLHGVVGGDRSGMVEWDGRTDGGAAVGPGVFHYQVRVSGRPLGSGRTVILR